MRQAVTGKQQIVAIPAEQQIMTIPTDQNVITALTVQDVVTRATREERPGIRCAGLVEFIAMITDIIKNLSHRDRAG